MHKISAEAEKKKKKTKQKTVQECCNKPDSFVIIKKKRHAPHCAFMQNSISSPKVKNIYTNRTAQASQWKLEDRTVRLPACSKMA